MSSRNVKIGLLSASVVFAALTGLVRGANPEKDSPVMLPGCIQFDLNSKEGRTYRIFVREPMAPVPEAGSPVVYLTDGNKDIIPMVAAANRQRSLANAVIVAIGYPELPREGFYRQRTRDLLFPVDPGWWESIPPQHRTYIGQEAGGAAAFQAFISDTLKPEIERRYKIDPDRQMLFGYSLGGLFVLHTFFERPDLFTMYFAGSPSIWVNDRSILKEISLFAEKIKKDKANGGGEFPSLYVSVGEQEAAGFTNDSDREEMLKARRQVDNVRELADILSRNIPFLNVTTEIFAGEDHGTALLPACNRAMRVLAESGTQSEN